MIKLRYLLNELYNIPGYVDREPNEFLKVFLKLVKKKYPESEWHTDFNELKSKDADRATIIAMAIKTTNPAVDPEPGKPYYVGIAMEDVATKQYKGVLGDAIKEYMSVLLRQNRDSMPALFLITDNDNNDAWEHVANKYNLTLITMDNWDEYVEPEEDPDEDPYEILD